MEHILYTGDRDEEESLCSLGTESPMRETCEHNYEAMWGVNIGTWVCQPMWPQRRNSSRGAKVEERFRKEGKCELILERCGVNQRKKGEEKSFKAEATGQKQCVWHWNFKLRNCTEKEWGWRLRPNEMTEPSWAVACGQREGTGMFQQGSPHHFCILAGPLWQLLGKVGLIRQAERSDGTAENQKYT